MTDPSTRELVLERLFNLRDLGGLTTADGGRVRSGMLYRDDDPVTATEADVVLDHVDRAEPL